MNPSDQAQKYITTCCRKIGAFQGSNRPYIFLDRLANDMNTSPATSVFPDRYKEHVAYAIKMVASNSFLSPPSAIASLYLATRFEYYFRVISGKLKGDGTWISSKEQATAQSSILDTRINRNRISSLSLAYRIMMLDSSQKIVQQFNNLDNNLYPTPITTVNGHVVQNIGDRIEFGRLVVGHGHWGDISSEAVFYGLLTGVVFYTQV